MTADALGNELDGGTLRFLAEQALEAAEGAEALAVASDRGDSVWFSPATLSKKQAAALALDVSQIPARRDTPGIRGRDGSHLIYDFAIARDEPDAAVHGTLSLLVEQSQSTTLAQVGPAIQPVIDCLLRQIDINAELSSIRRLSHREREGLRQVAELQRPEKAGSPELKAQRVLQSTVSQLKCGQGSLLLPADKLDIIEPMPRDERERKQALRVASKLFAQVRSEQRVVVASLEHNGGGSLVVLGCPVLDTRGSVTGLLTLQRDRRFNRDDVRVARIAAVQLSNSFAPDVDPRERQMSRHGLLTYIDGYIARHPNTSHSLFYFDLDKLHVVNDSFGHGAGDDAIARATSIFECAAGRQDLVLHLTGDRFAIFSPDCDEKDAVARAEGSLAALRDESFSFDGKSIEITASAGVAVIPEIADNASEALSIAEVASRAAKDRGGNRAVVHRDVDASMMQRRDDLEQVGYLQEALLSNRFELHAQPIRSLSGDTAGQRFELLLRMLDHDGGPVSPNRFMSSAESLPSLWRMSRSWPTLSRASTKAGLRRTRCASKLLRQRRCAI